jgi:hypothetical protein
MGRLEAVSILSSLVTRENARCPHFVVFRVVTIGAILNLPVVLSLFIQIVSKLAIKVALLSIERFIIVKFLHSYHPLH